LNAIDDVIEDVDEPDFNRLTYLDNAIERLANIIHKHTGPLTDIENGADGFSSLKTQHIMQPNELQSPTNLLSPALPDE
jgi:hypothetical protein